MRLASVLLLVFLISSALLADSYQAPQIWTLNGVSVAYTRAQIEQRLGRSVADRPLKASWGGETWEYTYRNGLKADFAGQTPASQALLLVGTDLRSRGLPLLKVPISRREVRRLLEDPVYDVPPLLVYADPARHAFLTLHLDDSGRVDEICISRFRIDPDRPSLPPPFPKTDGLSPAPR